MRLWFKFVSIEAPSIFTRNETFCEHKALLKVFGTMRLAGDLHQKNFRKISKSFFPNFLFFLRFTVEKDGFSVVSSWRRIVFEIYGYPFGIFWRCKIDEILTIMSFYPWLSVWYCSFGFLQKLATFFSSVCEARLRLCVDIAPTWGVLVLFFLQTTSLTLIGPFFRNIAETP